MSLVFSTQINTEQELIILTERICDLISKNSVVLLSGSLSSGKTTLVSHFCKLFGIDNVQSPTFAIHQRYSNKNTVIDHFDLYRLESDEDVQASGFYDLLSMPADYKFIEWPERIKERDIQVGQPVYKIVINIVDLSSRQVDVYKVS